MFSVLLNDFVMARRNDEEAATIMERVKELERRLAESEQRKARKTSGKLG